ncbi:hypothetical protein [Polaromonas naphthalenivorans]|nr:hypothetical protein [Polaromonas naphthalenivorans]
MSSTEQIEKPSWVVGSSGKFKSNAALENVFENEKLVQRQLALANLSMVGAILAYQFVANPKLHVFRIEVEKVARSFCEVTLVEAFDASGKPARAPSIEKLESDEALSLFTAFKVNANGVAEIQCGRESIADLLKIETAVNGAEAFHKFFPDYA